MWTLAGAGFSGPIAIEADGAPLIPGVESFNRDDFTEVSPLVESVGDSSFYTLAGGRLFSVADLSLIHI